MNKTINQQLYYGKQAYRSDKPRYQPDQLTWPESIFDKRLPWGYTKERVPIAMIDDMQPLALEEDERLAPYQPEIPREYWQIYNHEYLQNNNYRTISKALNFLLGGVRFLAIPVTVIMAITFFGGVMASKSKTLEELWESFWPILFFIPGIFYYLWGIGLIIKKYCPHILSLPGDGTVKWQLNRRTGLVTQYTKDQHGNTVINCQAPFDEFDGYLGTSFTRHGYLYEFLLYHRYEGWTLNITELTGFKTDHETVKNAWEFLQNYMDTSRALPEHPILEAYRHLDPTTAALDKKTGRDLRRIRDMTKEQYAKYEEEVGMPYNDMSHPCLFEQGGYVNYLPVCQWRPEYGKPKI